MAAEPFQLTPTSPKLSPTGNRVLRVCDYCGDLFDVPPALSDQRFCDRRCYEADRGGRITLDCEYCGESFDVNPCESDRRFCTRECFYAHRRGDDQPEAESCPHVDDYRDENGDCIQCDVERGAAEDVELKRQTSSDSLPLA